MELNRVKDTAADAQPKALYKVGSASAWIALLIFRRWLGPELLLFQRLARIHIGPSALPQSAMEWFTLLHAHPLVGLILLNAFDIVTFALAGVVFLALYAALRRTDRAFMTLSLPLALIGIAVYIASNPALPMIALSRQFAAAASEAERSVIAAVGQAVLAGKGVDSLGQNLAFTLVHIAGLIVSIAMLRSGVFSKLTAYTGILFNAFGLGFPLGMALAPGFLVIPMTSWIIAVVFWVFWYVGIACTLWRLGRGEP